LRYVNKVSTRIGLPESGLTRKPFEEEVVVGMADRSAVGMLAGAAVGSSLAAPLT